MGSFKLPILHFFWRERMPERSQDWYKQALRDLEQAVDSQKLGRHEWACFAAQQAAGKVVKALHLKNRQETWGHVVSRLLHELPNSIEIPELLIEKARVLDNYYIPARYPNGHPESAHFEHYDVLQSSEAIQYASEIIEFIGHQIAR
jgi:HEPN domain-containing protein